MMYKTGDRVLFNGNFPGTVQGYYSEGMIEIRGERGTVCIPERDAQLFTPAVNKGQTVNKATEGTSERQQWECPNCGSDQAEDIDLPCAECGAKATGG